MLIMLATPSKNGRLFGRKLQKRPRKRVLKKKAGVTKMPLFRYPRFLGPFLLIDCQNSEREIYRDKEEDKREGLGFRRAVSVKKKKGRDRER